MTRNSAKPGELTPMSELSNYKIESGDPDPRGWNLVGTGGERLGAVVDLLVDTQAMKVRQLLVDVGDGDGDDAGERSFVTIDVDAADVRSDSHDVLVRGRAGAAFDVSSAPRYEGGYSEEAPAADIDHGRLTRSEEEHRVGKREEAVVDQRVVEERDVIEADVRREQFDIQDPTTREREGQPPSGSRRSS